jgi:predicted deacetylase
VKTQDTSNGQGGGGYLLRFDDICPTMNWAMWRRVERVLVELNIKPILAVIPDNRDPVLQIGPVEKDFWNLVRGWQSLGWTIAVHGYQHQMVTLNSGLLGKNRYSEFAGLPEEHQREKFKRALSVFAREGVRSDILVAPAHSFDASTLRAAFGAGLRSISDGYGLYPYVDTVGMFWIPQQLTMLTPKRRGVWTVCMHPNWWTEDLYNRFRTAAAAFRPAITDVAVVAGRYGHRRMQWIDSAHAAYVSSNECLRSVLKEWLR